MPRRRARRSQQGRRRYYCWAAAAAAVAFIGHVASRPTAPPPGGWRGDATPAELLRGLDAPDYCDVDVVTEITSQEFETEYRGRKPLLLRGAASDWPALKKWTREYLLKRFNGRPANYGAGSDVIYAGGGPTNHATLGNLLERMRNQSDVFAFDAMLLRTMPEFAEDFATPSVLEHAFPATDRISGAAYHLLSVGPSRSGLPPHAHGETWLALVVGRKRWFLAAPGAPIPDTVHPLSSAIDWAEVLEGGCLQRPGDVVYVPRGWTHATLNIGDAVAVGEQTQWPVVDRLERSRAVLVGAPRDVRALHSVGVAAAHLELWDEAIAALKQAVDVTRGLQPEVAVLLAEALHAAGRPIEAAETIERCRGAYGAELMQPTRTHAPAPRALAAAHLKFARYYLGADAFEAALGPLGDALGLHPAYAEALVDRAYARRRLGDAPGARADLRAADIHAPGDARVRQALRALAP